MLVSPHFIGNLQHIVINNQKLLWIKDKSLLLLMLNLKKAKSLKSLNVLSRRFVIVIHRFRLMFCEVSVVTGDRSVVLSIH